MGDIDGKISEMHILACSVADFQSYFMKYYWIALLENFGNYSSLHEDHSVKISTYQDGLVSF